MTSSSTRAIGASSARPSARSDSSPDLRFWISDFGFWVFSGESVSVIKQYLPYLALQTFQNPKSKIQNRKSNSVLLRRVTRLVHLVGGGVHRFFGRNLAQQRLVQVFLDDVRLLRVAGHLRAHGQELELLAVDREVLHVLLQIRVAVQ